MTTESEIRSTVDADVAFTVRPYEERDAPAVVEMMNELEVSFRGDAYLTVAWIHDMTTSWVRSIPTDTRLAFAPDGLLVGVAMVAPPEDGGSFGDTFAGVRLGWLGRGIGRALLAWEFDRLREMHAQRAPVEAWTLHAGANVCDDASIRLFEHAQMTPVRYFFEMILPIADLKPVAMPDGYRVVPYTDDLAERLYQADDESFSDHWGYEQQPYDRWRTSAVDSELFRPEHTRIAFDGDEIAAYVLCYDDGAGNHYIDKVGTRRPWRRRGLASALMSETIAVAAADGKTVAALGVDADNATGALGVYERLGFAPRQRWVVYQKPLG